MKAVIENGYIKVYDAYLYRESIKEMEGRLYEPETKAWCVPITIPNILKLQVIGADISDEMKRMLPEEKPPGDEKPIRDPPIKGNLYQHQVKAFNFALKTLGVDGDDKQ